MADSPGCREFMPVQDALNHYASGGVAKASEKKTGGLKKGSRKAKRSIDRSGELDYINIRPTKTGRLARKLTEEDEKEVRKKY
ncbi:hypothetical protein LLH00_09175 [bacterium]|nr:hypothetical protein [bacterium]